jgi:NADH dehydrogenase [ubiquinone] 1 alpha subcomplex assembly factor 6
MPPKASLSYAAEEVRRYDRDRFVTSLFAPPDRREALFALYAFNLEVAKVPEVVREPMMGRIRIQWWRDRIEAAGTEMLPDHPIARPLLEAVVARSLDRSDFDRLLEAREEDLDTRPPADMARLEGYAGATGGSLTQLAAAILGAEGEVARAAARHVGIGWALTGLLRAVPFHASKGRLYLPLDRLAAHGLEPERIFAEKPLPELARVAEEVAERAAEHLRQARRHRSRADRRALPAMLPAVLADGYLAALAQRGYQPFAAGWAEPRPRPLRLTLSWALGRY